MSEFYPPQTTTVQKMTDDYADDFDTSLQARPMPKSPQAASPPIRRAAPQSPRASAAHGTSVLELQTQLRERDQLHAVSNKAVLDLRAQLLEVRARGDAQVQAKERALRAMTRKAEVAQAEALELKTQMEGAFQTDRFIEIDNARREKELQCARLTEENKKLNAQLRCVSSRCSGAALHAIALHSLFTPSIRCSP